MPKKQLDTLTESMYFTLIALLQPRCGIEITEFVNRITNGRVKLGPGTLYTLLSKFETERYIEEVAQEGRKRTYQISTKGKEQLKEEIKRLHMMLEEGEPYVKTEFQAEGKEELK